MLRRDASHLLRSRAAVHVGVVPERHLDVLMAHDVLQRLRVHARLRHFRAERVAQRVRCHALGKLHVPALRALAPQPPEHPVVITADPRQSVPVEEDEARAPIDVQGLRLRPRCHDMDNVYDGARAGYHVVKGVKKRLGGENPLSPDKSLGKLSEKKSAKKAANTVEAKRKAQAAGYFKKNVYKTSENVKKAASITKRGIKILPGAGKGGLGPLASLGMSTLAIPIIILLGLVLLISLLGSMGGNNVVNQSGNLNNLSGIQLEVAQALYDSGLNTTQVAAVMGNISGESSDWNPTSEYHGENGEYGFGLFQFTDAPSQGVYNYTDFANWCSANGKDKNTAGAQTEYLIRGLSSSWSTGLHYSGYYYAAAPQYNGMDVSYDAWLNTNDVGFATYCFMACYERPAAWAAKTSFPNKRLPAAQSFYEQLTDGGGQDYNASDETQKAIVDAAKRTPSPGAGYCAAWVSNVYENAGLPRPGGNACCQYLSFCTSTDRSQLKVGMVIGVQRSPTSNSNWCGGHLGYGHVGIYIGDGKVMENVGHIATTDLDSWIAYNGQLSQPRWGFPPGVH